MTKKELREELAKNISKHGARISINDKYNIADYILSPPCLKLLAGEFEVVSEAVYCKAPYCACRGEAIVNTQSVIRPKGDKTC